jgi:hypothetical protein
MLPVRITKVKCVLKALKSSSFSDASALRYRYLVPDRRIAVEILASCPRIVLMLNICSEKGPSASPMLGRESLLLPSVEKPEKAELTLSSGFRVEPNSVARGDVDDCDSATVH